MFTINLYIGFRNTEDLFIVFCLKLNFGIGLGFWHVPSETWFKMATLKYLEINLTKNILLDLYSENLKALIKNLKISRGSI